MEIIPVTKEMASTVSHIYALSWKTAYRNIVPQAYLDDLSLERWTPFLENSPEDGFAIKDHGELAAISYIGSAKDTAMQGWGEIRSIYVLPQHFYKGYGKKLLSFVLSELRNNGFEKVYLWVLEDNMQARNFYERNGFAANGDKENMTIGGKDLVKIRYIYRNKQV